MKKTYVLHSTLAPSAMADALRRSIDEGHRTLFSLSGYKGTKLILGEVGQNTFKLQKRRYSRNDFAGQFFARFEPERGGTRIEGYFDAPPWARWYMRIWLAGAVLIGTPLFISTLVDMSRGSSRPNDWVGLVVPPALILFGVAMPMVGRLFGRPDRRLILEHVQHTLGARLADTDSR
jgi:hypothetical protein